MTHPDDCDSGFRKRDPTSVLGGERGVSVVVPQALLIDRLFFIYKNFITPIPH